MANFTGKVTGGSLNLRQSASTNSTALKSIPNGTSLSVTTLNSSSNTRNWFQTSYDGASGYVMARYVAITSGGQADTVTTSSGPLNVREVPDGTIIYTAAQNSVLRALDTSSVSGWHQVSGASGTGWGSSQYLTLGGSSGGGGTTVTLGDWVTVGIVSGGCTTYKTPSTSGEVYSGIGSAGGVVTAYLYTGTNQDSWLVYKTSNINTFFLAKYARGNEYNTSQTGRRAKITGSGVNLREIPSTSNNTPFATLDKDTKVLFLAVKDGFRRVLTPRGMGWVHGDYMAEY